MTFVITMHEKETGATATQQGVKTANKTTLGEVQLALGETKARVKGMSKFYTAAWKSRGEKFLKLIEAAPEKIDAVKIYKKGRNTSAMFTREVAPKDWVTKSGYGVKVWSQDEKNSMDETKAMKISNAVMNMPGNPKLIEIYQRKLLEMAELTPDEINEVMSLEEQKQQQLMNTQQVTGQTGITGGPGQPPTPLAPPPPKPQPGQPINNSAKPPMMGQPPMATARR